MRTRLALFDVLFAALHEHVPRRPSRTGAHQAHLLVLRGVLLQLHRGNRVHRRGGPGHRLRRRDSRRPPARTPTTSSGRSTSSATPPFAQGHPPALRTYVAAEHVPRADHGGTSEERPGSSRPGEPRRQHRVRRPEPGARHPRGAATSATSRWTAGFPVRSSRCSSSPRSTRSADGNGRVARALANAELSAARQQRLIDPDRLPRRLPPGAPRDVAPECPGALIKVLTRAQAWAGGIDWSSMASARPISSAQTRC